MCCCGCTPHTVCSNVLYLWFFFLSCVQSLKCKTLHFFPFFSSCHQLAVWDLSSKFAIIIDRAHQPCTQTVNDDAEFLLWSNNFCSTMVLLSDKTHHELRCSFDWQATMSTVPNEVRVKCFCRQSVTLPPGCVNGKQNSHQHWKSMRGKSMHGNRMNQWKIFH